MTTWTELNSIEQIRTIDELSRDQPVLIFKHSTTCSISAMAKMRLEDQWESSGEFDQIYYLDLLRYRAISNEIAKHYHVHHESPQLLVIKDGECILDSSHLQITLDEVAEVA